jgi:hypothetical protein
MDKLAYCFWGFLNASGYNSGDDIFHSGMATFTVLNELIFSVISDSTRAAVVRFFIGMTALMVVAITNSCKALSTMRTFIRLLPSVGSNMNKEISSLIKQLFTMDALIVGQAEIANLSPKNVSAFTDLLGLLNMG